VTAAIVMVGGLTGVAGTLLPWMTLFGGLHTYRGIIGVYGRLIAGGGALAIALGVLLSARDYRLIRLAAALLGAAIFVAATILLRNMLTIVGNHRADPMMISAQGWGLYVCMAGATLLCAAPIPSLGLFKRRL